MRSRARLIIVLFFIHFVVLVQGQVRKEINIPDIPGYLTLKCDFHMHTVFSDGNVWPTIRVTEAWENGLDAIAITDHIEYRPHSQDIKSDHNRSFEISKPLADQLGIILIRGAEITRQMPPGHLNAIFILNANLLERDDWFEACMEARDQGAFIFWNHPGWREQQPIKTQWMEAHTKLYDAGLMQGIEVYNTEEYYPEALNWSFEKDLTLLCNSDMHDPVSMEYDLNNSHRPMTLVFAAERSAEAIRLALENKRTAIYFENTIIGKEEFLQPLFKESIEIVTENITSSNSLVKTFFVHNLTDVDLILEQSQPTVGFYAPEKVILKAQRTTLIQITSNADETVKISVFKMFYKVKNFVTGPTKNDRLRVVLEVQNYE